MSISWACARFVNSTGFTVNLDSDSKGLSLFDNGDGENPTTRLTAEPLEDMWNISVDWLPDNLAYTFELGNDTKSDIKYNSTINVDAQEKNADNAIRVRLIRNGVKKDYAKASANGKAETVAADATWIDPTIVMKENAAMIKSGERVKYTVVIWFEGDDPECVNDILGGEVKLSMTFDVVDDEAGNGELV